MKSKRPPSEKLIELLSDYKVEVGEMALALRDVILAEEPDAIETLHKSYAVSMAYSFTGKWTQGFCMVVVYPGHVNLGFNQGAFLPDPDGTLEGSGKQMRHIKVASREVLQKPCLLTFIKAAAKLSREDRKSDDHPSPRPRPSSSKKVSRKK